MVVRVFFLDFVRRSECSSSLSRSCLRERCKPFVWDVIQAHEDASEEAEETVNNEKVEGTKDGREQEKEELYLGETQEMEQDPADGKMFSTSV